MCWMYYVHLTSALRCWTWGRYLSVNIGKRSPNRNEYSEGFNFKLLLKPWPWAILLSNTLKKRREEAPRLIPSSLPPRPLALRSSWEEEKSAKETKEEWPGKLEECHGVGCLSVGMKMGWKSHTCFHFPSHWLSAKDTEDLAKCRILRSQEPDRWMVAQSWGPHCQPGLSWGQEVTLSCVRPLRFGRFILNSC